MTAGQIVLIIFLSVMGLAYLIYKALHSIVIISVAIDNWEEATPAEKLYYIFSNIPLVDIVSTVWFCRYLKRMELEVR